MAIAMATVLLVNMHAAQALLSDSKFENLDGNIVVDNSKGAGSLDWANVTQDSKADEPTGSTDDSFGQGTKEDTRTPTVVNGSIPNNKSDLLNFGVYLEKTDADTNFLNMYWSRVQEPTGTTNMDFEFNQSKVKTSNGVTPVRTAGDVLIQYDLTQGGTNPELFVSRWVTSGSSSQCEAKNSTPCWGTRENLTDAGDATGSINTSPIPAAESDGIIATGNLSPRTFGEAQIDFSALSAPGENCTSFGSAYLKSRASDSFTAALKDFISPLDTDISNCGAVKIVKKDNAGAALNGATFTAYQDVAPLGGEEPGPEDTTSENSSGSCTTANDNTTTPTHRQHVLDLGPAIRPVLDRRDDDPYGIRHGGASINEHQLNDADGNTHVHRQHPEEAIDAHEQTEAHAAGRGDDHLGRRRNADREAHF